MLKVIWSFHGPTPFTSVRLCRIFFALIFVSAPLIVPRLIDLSSHSLRHLLCTRRFLSRTLRRDDNTRYASPEEEQRYWASAIPAQRWLDSTSARARAHAKLIKEIPLITSYTPALLPLYREPRGKVEEGEYYLSARAFCKWHRMVFPGPVHPTLQQAAKLRRNFSNRERREMFRISRMLADEVVFRRKYHWTPKYRDLWRRWRAEMEEEVVVVFA
ncbi:hypothetical protein FPV67DRAFT_1776415 [Lyophyllum atratum]|nr:hypothetical protein FPV67DRAFT_1776415 [Lyophyllum atratum]